MYCAIMTHCLPIAVLPEDGGTAGIWGSFLCSKFKCLVTKKCFNTFVRKFRKLQVLSWWLTFTQNDILIICILDSTLSPPKIWWGIESELRPMKNIFDAQTESIRSLPVLLTPTIAEILPKRSHISNYLLFIQTLANKCAIKWSEWCYRTFLRQII